MFENIAKFFKRLMKAESHETSSREAAKERLHLVLMQDRANVSADFLEMMKQEIIEVIKKYIDVDENAIDVKLTNKTNDDGTNGAPALYANIPIISIKEEKKEEEVKVEEKEKTVDEKEKVEETDKKKSINKEDVKEEKEEASKEEKEETNNNVNGTNKEEIEKAEITETNNTTEDSEEKKEENNSENK